MTKLSDFPNWNKIWIFWLADKWDFTPCKENIPEGAIACEYTLNNDPFKCKVKREIIEEREA